jgi:hypothetical protein
MAGGFLLMQFNGRAKDYLATDEEVPNRDAGKLPVTSVKNGSIVRIGVLPIFRIIVVRTCLTILAG